MRRTLLLLFAFVCLHLGADNGVSIRVVSYNVENLFDCNHDSLKNDSAFLPDSPQHWTQHRYRNKLHKIAQVICNIGAGQPPAIVGMMEVENDSCLNDLCRYHLLPRHFPYRYLHYESADPRGIDVALLYDTLMLRHIVSHPISVSGNTSKHPTRDVLYSAFVLTDSYRPYSHTPADTLHCFVCHLPSQLGGIKATSHRRQQVIDIIKQHSDSLLEANQNAAIIVMGDFNTAPANSLPPLVNTMLTGFNFVSPSTPSSPKAPAPHSQHADESSTTFDASDIPADLVSGTHKYQGIWSTLDQFYLSPALYANASPALIYAPLYLLEQDNRYLGYKPFRTYSGPRYLGGYSDHLPIYIDIRL